MWRNRVYKVKAWIRHGCGLPVPYDLGLVHALPPETILMSETEVSIVAELTQQLKRPMKASPQWQEHTGNLVSKAHFITLGSTRDDLEYLQALSACKWAQSAGVGAAKKKDLQPIRFRTKEPPLLTALTDPNLQLAAIELLQSVRADWCQPYLSRLALIEDLDRKAVKALLKWAKKIGGQPAQLIATLVTPRLDVNAREARTLSTIKEITTHCVKLVAADPTQALPAFVELASDLGPLMRRGGVSKKVQLELWKLLLSLSQQIRLTLPQGLLHESTLQAVRGLSETLRGSPHAELAEQLEAELKGPTVQLLGWLAEVGGHEGASFVSLVHSALLQTYAGVAKNLAEHSKQNSALKFALAGSDSSTETDGSLEDFAADRYARLLPAWHDFLTAYPNPDELRSIDINLMEAASFNGIEFKGKRGDSVNFDPIEHRLKAGDLPSNGSVRIVRPPLIFRRSNGTHRIVLPGLVESM